MSNPALLNKNHLHTAESYYQALQAKDFSAMESYLHQEVFLISPLDKLQGREAVITAAKGLSSILQGITIRSRFEKDDQVVLIYDFIFSSSVGTLRAACLMSFRDHLIATIELFYDGRPF